MKNIDNFLTLVNPFMEREKVTIDKREDWNKLIPILRKIKELCDGGKIKYDWYDIEEAYWNHNYMEVIIGIDRFLFEYNKTIK